MSTEGEKVRFAIKRLVEDMGAKSNKVCYARNVSADPLTGVMLIDCEIVEDGSVIEDVRLCADFNENSTTAGMIMVPKLDSVVIVSFLGESEAYLSMVSEVDFVYLNANTFGGLIKIDAQTAKLNLLVAQLQAQLALIAAGIAAGGGTYTPGLLSTFNKSDYENEKVQHGNGTLV